MVRRFVCASLFVLAGCSADTSGSSAGVAGDDSITADASGSASDGSLEGVEGSADQSGDGDGDGCVVGFRRVPVHARRRL